MKKILLATLLSAVSIMSSAKNTTTNFNLNAKLESKCLMSAQNVSFGEINPLIANGSALGRIDVLCSKGIAYIIQPEGGVQSGWIQMMKNTQNNDGFLITLEYRNDLNNRVNWSREGSGWVTLSGVGVGQNKSHNLIIGAHYTNSVQGNFPSATNSHNYNASPGIYTTNITATIIY